MKMRVETQVRWIYAHNGNANRKKRYENVAC